MNRFEEYQSLNPKNVIFGPLHEKNIFLPDPCIPPFACVQQKIRLYYFRCKAQISPPLVRP